MHPTITVVYHKADFDGIFCREIARHFLGNEGVNYVGWDFGDEPLNIPVDHHLMLDRVVVMDLPVAAVFGITFKDGWVCRGAEQLQPIDRWDVTWIDHHKSSIESHPEEIPGYRIDGVAACRLAWQWFLRQQRKATGMITVLPDKLEFTQRRVQEPWAVRLAGEYDIWDRRDPHAAIFQFGLASVTDLPWAELLSDRDVDTSTMLQLLQNGRLIQAYQQQYDAGVVLARSFTIEWEGLHFLVLNTAKCNSLTFTAAITSEHDALMGFFFNGNKWVFSMYHAPGHEQHDLSSIAARYGGGGHRGACGFSMTPIGFAHIKHTAFRQAIGIEV